MLTLTLAIALLAALGAAVGMAPGRASDQPPPAVTVTTTTAVTVESSYHGVTAHRWAARFKHRTRQLQDALHYARHLERIVQTRRRIKPRFHGPSVWDRLADCESGGDWAANTGNGFYGGLQFVLSTWAANGGSGMPNQASREQQISVAERVLASQGWGAWPACSAQLGLR